jgi:hypothetical protein
MGSLTCETNGWEDIVRIHSCAIGHLIYLRIWVWIKIYRKLVKQVSRKFVSLVLYLGLRSVE